MFNNLKVKLSLTQQWGVIEGTFGKSGKIKVRLEEPIPEETVKDVVGSQIELHYKKNMMKKAANVNKFK